MDHSILLKKLYKYGVRGLSYEYFKSYVSNRKRYVAFEGVVSSETSITCGVPQRSFLGPLLFTICNDLVNATTLLSHYYMLMILVYF